MLNAKGKAGSVNLVQRNLALKRIFNQRKLIRRRAAEELLKPQNRHKALDSYNALIVRLDSYNALIVSFVLYYGFGIRSKKTVSRICRALESPKMPIERVQADIIGRTLSQSAREAMVERNQAAQRNAIGIILGDREKGAIFWEYFKEIREARAPKLKSKRQKK